MEDVLRILAYFVLKLTSRTLTSLCTLEIPELQGSELETWWIQGNSEAHGELYLALTPSSLPNPSSSSWELGAGLIPGWLLLL